MTKKESNTVVCMCCGAAKITFLKPVPIRCSVCKTSNLPCIVCEYEECVPMFNDGECPYKPEKK